VGLGDARARGTKRGHNGNNGGLVGNCSFVVDVTMVD